MGSSTSKVFDAGFEFDIEFPAFVRKVDKPNDWRERDDDTADKRVERIVSRVFRNAEGGVSVFLTKCETDLARVSIGLNSGRSSLSERLLLLWVKPGELLDAGLNVAQAPGDTLCDHANRCHHNIDYSQEALAAVALKLVSARRDIVTLTPSRMKDMIAYAESIGCNATDTELPSCVCESTGDFLHHPGV